MTAGWRACAGCARRCNLLEDKPCGGTVYARVSTYSGDMDSFMRHFQSVIVELEQWNGLNQVHVLVNRETGRAMTISIWADKESMEASDADADELRDRVTGGRVRDRACPRPADCGRGHAGAFSCSPHPEVLQIFRRKASDYDRWLAGMRRLRETVQPA